MVQPPWGGILGLSDWERLAWKISEMLGRLYVSGAWERLEIPQEELLRRWSVEEVEWLGFPAEAAALATRAGINVWEISQDLKTQPLKL